MSDQQGIARRSAHTAFPVAPAFYRIADVIRITAISRATIYRRISEGRFPRPVNLGGRARGWTPAALQEWIENPEEYREVEVQQTPEAASPVRRRRNTERLKSSRIQRRKFRTQVGHESKMRGQETEKDLANVR
ncbi:AlpA family phage regulatory protein [uncultured Castellaniella sp.]|uniref:helix-turn-helix transcriptional regulator n=1 Tax=uncultured Castellaniella sp. TaxID=647907 RepID=UPI0026247F82|nr:AlpA family phage regulatory protein [uncultured Castellaniella sp.]